MPGHGHGLVGGVKPKKKKPNIKLVSLGLYGAKPDKPKKPKKSKNHFTEFYQGQLKSEGKKANNGWLAKHKKKGSKAGYPGSHTNSGSSSSTHALLGGGGGGGRGRGRGRGHGGGKKKGKGKGPPSTNRTEASSIVQADANAQMLALLNQATGQRDTRDYEVRKANALYDRTSGDLDYLFNEAKDFNAAKTAENNTRFDTTRTDINNLFNTFKTDNADAVSGRRDAAAAELQRLGIQQAGLGSFDRDASAAASMADLNQTGANANLDAMKFGSNEIGNMLAGMATGENMADKGRAMNARNDNISQLNQAFAQYMQGVLGKQDEINAGKFTKTSELAMQMQQQRFTQFMQMKAAGMHPGLTKAAKKKQAAAQAAQLKQYLASGNNLGNLLGGLR